MTNLLRQTALAINMAFARAFTGQHMLEFGLPHLGLEAVHFNLWQSFWFMLAMTAFGPVTGKEYVEKKCDEPWQENVKTLLTPWLVLLAIYAIV